MTNNNQGKQWYSQRFHLMGTYIDIQIQHYNGEILLNECLEKLQSWNQIFSANDDTSELMLLNKQAGIQKMQVDEQLYDLIAYGQKASLEQETFLNIALGPIIKLWRIGFTNAKKPTEQKIQQVLKITNPQSIKLLENRYIYLEEKGMEIDLGSLAKGYFADLLCDFLHKNDVANGLINLGGNVLVWGQSPMNKLWHIGIQKPFGKANDYLKIVSISNKSIVTSGIYQRTFKYQNKQYHHIFDSKTGYPITNDVASLTIIAETSLEAEKWTTALFGYVSDQIIEIVDTIPNVEACVITHHQHLKYSNNFLNYTI